MSNRDAKRQIHVSPGIYFTENEISVASKSLGITNLGVVGETLRGPAFQVIDISSWGQYKSYFGGTSTEHFIGSQYPKYELPYIAKTYLEESKNLKVCRVLGLSGVNAGPAWVITACSDKVGATYSEKKPMIVAILRSKADYRKAAFKQKANPAEGVCEDEYEYDKLTYLVNDIKLCASDGLAKNEACISGFIEKEGTFRLNPSNLGKFSLKVILNETRKVTTTTVDEDGKPVQNTEDKPIEKIYSVSLNKGDKNYIFNVIGSKPDEGDSEIFVEELYDVALRQMVEAGELSRLGVKLSSKNDSVSLPQYSLARMAPKYNSVVDILTRDESTLNRSDVGKRYLYSREHSINAAINKPLQVHEKNANEETDNKKGDTKGNENDKTTGNVNEDNNKNDKGQANGNKKGDTKVTTIDSAIPGFVTCDGDSGTIYTVATYVTSEGTRKYIYLPATTIDSDGKETVENLAKPSDEDSIETVDKDIFEECVFVERDGSYYVFYGGDVQPITIDLNNYREQFRYASTPWIVSELKGSANNVDLHKLFRFHTISDGDNSTFECKISIENIMPDNGTFDVVVRDYNDYDGNAIVLERYNNVDLIPGSPNYISLKIGSFDEGYEAKSKYITVEVNENELTKKSIPAGFLGYPIRNYKGTGKGLIHVDKETELQKPHLKYNTNLYDDIRVKRQYFGMSDIVGIDDDVLKYKGVEAYNNVPDGLTPCFHLDSRIFSGKPDADGYVHQKKINGTNNTKQDAIKQKITVDGIGGYEWETVGIGNTRENYNIEPRIGSEEEMLGTIYEDKRARKFTLCFYGGFDGWDYYRTSRTNTDEFKAQQYRGVVDDKLGVRGNFSLIRDTESMGFDRAEKAITSDWYAYLYGIRQFANPKENDINLLATPGIDYVNNTLLVNDVVEMVEEERADCIYVVTTPDKPFGFSNSKSDMFTADEAVANLDSSGIDSSYACTYYPWIKYYDGANNQYIYLPPTKDVVKNFANTDNIAAPWYSSAGWTRGLSDGVKAKKNLVMGEQEELYFGRINYINTFANEGMRIWGDKNLQVAETQTHLNRISTRRCLIRLRKLISIGCIGFVFEPNDQATADSFRGVVEGILEDFVSKRALVDAKLVIDNSEETRDRLELRAQIYLKVMPKVEYIKIGLTLTPSGVSFDDI